MMKQLILVISLVLLTTKVLAAGGGGHSSVTDLIFPAINAIIFFSFLYFKLRKPVANMFIESADKIEEFNSLAEKKDKEAKAKLEMLQQKMNNLNVEVEKIQADTKQDVGKFKTQLDVETKEKIERMNRDAKNKIESENNEVVRNIYSELVDSVIVKAKSSIKADGSKKDKATSKLISQL